MIEVRYREANIPEIMPNSFIIKYKRNSIHDGIIIIINSTWNPFLIYRRNVLIKLYLTSNF